MHPSIQSPIASYALTSRKQKLDGEPVSFQKLLDASATIVTRYHIPAALWSQHLSNRQSFASGACGYRDVARSTDERTMIATVVSFAGFMQPLNGVSHQAPEGLLRLVACLNSFALDFACRQKTPGTHVNVTICKQLPIVSEGQYLRLAACVGADSRFWLLQRALELTYTAWDLQPFADDCGWPGPPFLWDEDRRFLLRSELDAAFFHLYLPAETNGDWRSAEGETAEDLARLKASFPTPRDAVAYIMDTFPIVRRKDEEKFNGDYRTKRVILEIYDAMQAAIRTGQHYQTRLDPLPGPPADAVGTMMSMYQLDRGDWPPHIHLPHPNWEESLLAAWFGIRKRKWKYLEDEQMFPWDGREAFAYALIPYLVRERPGEKFEFYRDAALLASYPKCCETLLLEDGLRESYRQAMHGLDWLQFPEAHRIRPRRLRETLQGKELVHTDPGSGATTHYSAATLPPLPSDLKSLMPLFLKAADNLERVQQDSLERAETAKLGAKREDLTRELSALMVA